MHFFESDVHPTVRGMTNPGVNLKRMHQFHSVTNEMFMKNRPIIFLLNEPNAKYPINPLYNNGFEQKVMYCYIFEPHLTNDGDSFEQTQTTQMTHMHVYVRKVDKIFPFFAMPAFK